MAPSCKKTSYRIFSETDFVQQLEGGYEAAYFLVENGQLFLQVPTQRVVHSKYMADLIEETAFLCPERVENALKEDQTFLLRLSAFIVVSSL